MKHENGRIILFLTGYYKRQFVNVPLRHLPDGAITNEGYLVPYRFVLLDSPSELDPLPVRESKAAQKYYAGEEVTIVPEELSERALRNLCETSDIPLMWVTGRSLPKQNRLGKYVNRRDDRKIRSLTNTEYKAVYKKLKKIDKKSALVVNLLWYINSQLAEGGAYVTLEEVLRMRVQDFTPMNETSDAQIYLKRVGLSHQIVSLSIPSQLANLFCRQIDKNSMFIFSNRHGGPLLPVKVDADLKQAGKIAGIKEVITSLALRPQFKKIDVTRSAALSSRHQLTVTDQEWETIRRQVPSITNRRGRKATHHPRDHLNSILHLYKTKCSFPDLPAYPPWQAVESQHRRWKKHGTLDAIFSCLVK